MISSFVVAGVAVTVSGFGNVVTVGEPRVGVADGVCRVRAAEPCACFEDVALGKNTMVNGSGTEDVPVKEGTIESDVVEPTVYAAPQGIAPPPIAFSWTPARH